VSSLEIGSARVAIVPSVRGFQADLRAKLDAELRSLGRPDVPVGLSVDKTSMAQVRALASATAHKPVDLLVQAGLKPQSILEVRNEAQAALSARPLEMPVDLDLGGAAAADLAGSASRRSHSLFGTLMDLLNAKVPLFGGAANAPAMLSWLPRMVTEVAAWHVAMDGAVEALAVLTPAAIALGVYGLASAEDVKAMAQQLNQMRVVSTATGQAIYPLGNGISKLNAAVKPSLYQIFGDALSLMGTNSNALDTGLKSVGSTLDQVAARVSLALGKGNGLGGFLTAASKDLGGVLNVMVSVGGIADNLLHSVPGTAAVLLHGVEDTTSALERLTSSGVVQGITKVGLGLHSIVLWGGLGATAGGAAIRGTLTAVGNLSEKIGMAAAESDLLGGALASRVAPAMLGFSAATAEAAALPWGFIAAGAAGLGLLVVDLLNAKDATQQFTASQQAAVNAATAGSAGFAAILHAQTVETLALTSAQKEHAALTAQMNADLASGNGAARGVVDQLTALRIRTDELSAGQSQFVSESELYSQRLGQLGKQYGSTAAAQGLLVAAGIPMSDFLSRNAQTWAEVKQEVAATTLAFKAFAPQAGILGADLFVMSQQANSQLQAIDQLNQAWSAWLGMSTGLQGGMLSVDRAMGQLKTDAKAAGASFTGVNGASLTLQQAFTQQITTLGNLEGSLRQAGAPAKSMAEILSTSLLPQVKQGALQNAAFRTQIDALATAAGYAGPNKIGPLTKWLEQNATSLKNANKLAEEYAAALAKLPSHKSITISAYLNASPAAQKLLNAGANPGGELRVGGYASGTSSAAPGWSVVGEDGPELIRLKGGEQIIPTSGFGALAGALASGGSAASGLGGSSSGDMHVVQNFNGYSANQLMTTVGVAINAAAVRQGKALRIGRRG